jgi:hypothetical protein
VDESITQTWSAVRSQELMLGGLRVIGCEVLSGCEYRIGYEYTVWPEEETAERLCTVREGNAEDVEV